MARRKWSELSPRRRQLLIAAAASEGVLKAAALVDPARRPADEVRGPKPVPKQSCDPGSTSGGFMIAASVNDVTFT
jgi:hypothetical protein